jgi:hypothetical protein
VKLPGREAHTQGVEQRVKHSYLICSGRQPIEPEAPERICLKRSARALDQDLGPSEIPAVEAVENYANDLPLAAHAAIGWVQRGVNLCAKAGRNNHDHRDEDLTLSDHFD